MTAEQSAAQQDAFAVNEQAKADRWRERATNPNVSADVTATACAIAGMYEQSAQEHRDCAARIRRGVKETN